LARHFASSTAVAVKLSLPDPYDLTDIDLSEYKGIVAPRNNWRAVHAHCAHSQLTERCPD